MKKITSIYKIALLTLTVLLAANFSYSQAPTVTINYNATGLTPGDSISVPIVLNGTTVGNWRFLIRYDRDVLSYGRTINTVGASGFFNSINTYTITSGVNAGEVVYVAGLAYTGGAPGYTYSNQTILTLRFKYMGGQTAISFINISSGGATNNDTYVKANPYNTVNLGTVFTNGSATGPYLTLQSVATGDWKTAGTWDLGVVPSRIHNVVVNSNHFITDTSTTGRCHDLTIQPLGQLTVASGKALTVNGNFLIGSDVTGAGSFIDLGTTAITGTKTVQRYMTGNWTGGFPISSTIWHYVSSPVASATISTFLTCLMNQWNEVAVTWDPLDWPVTIPMVVGKGYAVATPANMAVTFSGGNLNTGDQSITGLTRTAPGGGAHGWNLIGNAFPSAFVWNSSVVRTNVDAAIYLWNGSTYTSKLPDDASIVPLAQGFFVHVNENPGTVMIPNTNRTHNNVLFYKAKGSNILTLVIEGNGYADETSIRFNELATEGWDGEYDAYKLMGIEDAPQIYTLLPDLKLSINSLPDLTVHPVIQLGLKVGEEGMYTITARDLETFAAGTDLYIEDLLINKVQDLNDNNIYAFSASPGAPEHRFNLHFAPVGINEPGKEVVQIYAQDKIVYVKHLDGISGKISVCDMLGHEIKHTSILPGTLDKISLDVPSGYYVVKMISDAQVIANKVFIR